MSRAPSTTWYSANQGYLMAALNRVKQALQAHHVEGKDAESIAPPDESWPTDEARPPALGRLCVSLGLSSFERDVLMLAAGMEFEGSFAALCGRAQGDEGKPYPTFGLALAALPDAEWSAISPSGALRHWQLLEVGPGNAITSSPIRIDEPILHFLTGLSTPDERLAGLSEPLVAQAELAPSHLGVAEQIAATWSRTAGSAAFPVVQLCGREVGGKRDIAAQIGERLSLRVDRVLASALPSTAAEIHKLCRLWNRESVLNSTALLVDCEDLDPGDTARDVPVRLLIEAYRGPLLLATSKRRPPIDRPVLSVDVDRPLPPEQREFWQRLLAEAGVDLDGHVDRLVGQFDISLPTIRAALAGALGVEIEPEEEGESGNNLARVLWHSCRLQARPRLDDLAERIRLGATWEDLVLPEEQKSVLRRIAAHVHHRATVFDAWGFGGQTSRGTGISVLFAGPSGTGKTLAAEVLARELDLDLYRIDLASVVSKYIGETEKNLSRVFDAAEAGGAVLLFDEADALFGKRSEVKDSHDRYANLEVSYLLQRIEAYSGLAILTTNLREALDLAFLRRLRFIVEFPFPGVEERTLIWRRVLPSATPTQGLDFDRLGQLSVTGGKIRNIALTAAFLAAEAGEDLTMHHLRTAANAEYSKAQETLPQSEIEGWA